MPDATARGVGEFGLIDAVVARLRTSGRVLLGPGDDAAVVAVPDGRVVATTDVLVQDVHFRLDWSSAYDVGRKAAAANLADVAAMGATGTALLVGLAAPADLPVRWATDLADGLDDEAALVGAVVVGGDTVTNDRIVVSVTALGDLAGRPPVTRAGAQPGDRIVLVGTPGLSGAGLAWLSRHRPPSDISDREPDPSVGTAASPAWALEIVTAHRRPRPPYAFGPALAACGATAMCDVSDGLLADLGHLAEASQVAMELDAEALPVAVAVQQAAGELGLHPMDLVLTGGEDHCLLATLPPEVEPPAGAVPIGRVRAGSGVTVLGHVVKEPAWKHFT